MDVADEEEFQYLGAGAFALLTMAGADPACHGTGVGVGDGLRYRQVADKKRPVFFLKNPSKVYGQQASGDNPEDRALAKIMELMRVQPIPVPELVKQYVSAGSLDTGKIIRCFTGTKSPLTLSVAPDMRRRSGRHFPSSTELGSRLPASHCRVQDPDPPCS